MTSKKKIAIIASLIVILAISLVVGLVVVDDFNHPARVYATQVGLPNGVDVSSLEETWGLDDGTKEKAILDYTCQLDSSLQVKFLNSILAIGSIDEQYNQIQFLSSFPFEQQVSMIKDGSAFNFDIDADGKSNYFEKMVSKTPYATKNDVYAIIMTQAGHKYEPVQEIFDMFGDMDVPENNVIDLTAQKNNSTCFDNAAKELSSKADKNDIVLIYISGEGSPGYFHFKDGSETVNYKWFADRIGKISSDKTIVVVESCYSGSAMPSLEGANNRLIITAGSAEEKSDSGIAHELLKGFFKSSADKDGNGYVSIAEAAKYAVEKQTADIVHPQLSDLGNIGATSYLADIQVK